MNTSHTLAPADPTRFREQLGTHYAEGAAKGHHAGTATYSRCPHPDCVRARAPVAA